MPHFSEAYLLQDAPHQKLNADITKMSQETLVLKLMDEKKVPEIAQPNNAKVRRGAQLFAVALIFILFFFSLNSFFPILGVKNGGPKNESIPDMMAKPAIFQKRPEVQKRVLFFGSSQMAGWQGSYRNPFYPPTMFYKWVAPNVKVVLDAVVGDPIGLGMLNRVKVALNAPKYDWVVYSAGSFDAYRSCEQKVALNIETLYAIGEEMAKKATNVYIFLPYRGGKALGSCSSAFQNLLAKFGNIARKLQVKYPNIRFGDWRNIINPNLYTFDGGAHLNYNGNRILGQAMVSYIGN